jgi:hypothetical protein
MFFKLPDDSVHDHTGKMLYFSANRFIDEICHGDSCFICGSRRERREFNDEHILPDWILRRYQLHDKEVVLPNGTGFRYGRYKIPCCKTCNSEMGDVFENPIRELIAQGHEAVCRYAKASGVWRLFTWMTLIFLKTHLKDKNLQVHRDTRLGEERIGDSYAWEEFHHLHCIARAFYTRCELDPTAHGSVFILQAEIEDDSENFDFCDLYKAQSMLLRLGETALIAVLNDSCAAFSLLRHRLNELPGPLSTVQLREFMAHCAFINLNLKPRPTFVSDLNLREERYRIYARLPEKVQLGECKQSEFGKIFYHLLRDSLTATPTLTREEVHEAAKQGRFSF